MNATSITAVICAVVLAAAVAATVRIKREADAAWERHLLAERWRQLAEPMAEQMAEVRRAMVQLNVVIRDEMVKFTAAHAEAFGQMFKGGPR